MLANIIGWILGIVLKTGLVCLLWIGVKTLIKSGGGTIESIMSTIATAIRCGCIKLRQKMVQQIKEEKEQREEQPDTPETAEGSVV